MNTAAIRTADTEYRRMRAYYMAEQAVTCPTCKAEFARDCQSTGGGNPAPVPTHKARKDRVAHWTDEQRHQYGELARAYHRSPSDAPVDQVEEAEAAAKPIPTRTAKQPTPKGVRLTEVQAERIEVTAASGGITWVPTTHLSGDAANRQCANALVAKGIIEATGVQTRYYEAEHRLTDFGWQVYLNHRLIIRREEGDRCAAEALGEAPARLRMVVCPGCDYTGSGDGYGVSGGGGVCTECLGAGEVTAEKAARSKGRQSARADARWAALDTKETRP